MLQILASLYGKIHYAGTRTQFCCKMWGGQLDVKPI